MSDSSMTTQDGGDPSQREARTAAAAGPPARAYRITVKGTLDDRWSSWFDGLRITHDANGDTTLVGTVRDQAALHGLLAKIRDLGLTLLAVRGSEPVAAIAVDRVRRFAVIAAFAGVWMAVGWAWNLGAVAYLLAGIPLTLGFQVLVARKPIRSLWLVDARPFHLDRGGIVIALGLAALPLYATAVGLAGGRVLDVAYGLVGVAGAAPAAFALRAMDSRARRALARSILTAGTIATLLFIANRILTLGPSVPDPAAALQAFAISLVLYVPMVFVIEEVSFRGALDTYARGPRLTNDAASAIFVSLVWGAWHLPLVWADGGLARVPITLGFHLVVGLLLTLPWRRSGNLAVPGVTHALIDAIRDGLAVT